MEDPVEMGATMMAEVLGRVRGLEMDRAEREVASYVMDSVEVGEEERPGPERDEMKVDQVGCEAEGKVEEKCGRCTQN